MTKIEQSHIENKGGGGVEWKMDAFIKITYHNDDIDEYTDSRLYTDGQYGFYERTHTICSDNYSATFRFVKDRMTDVFQFLANNPPSELEFYIRSIDGCEIISQERY